MKSINIIEEGKNFFLHLYTSRNLLIELTKRDFRERYVKNLFGLAWAILDPLAFICILWFIFSYFRSGGDFGVPFAVYLITGLIAFLFFSDALNQATNSIKAYSFLIKKVNFRISVLPLVKILSGLLLHSIVLSIAIIILIIYGIYPSLYWCQLFYYIFALSMLLIGITWATASIVLFFPDISNIINIIIRFGFYLTPIFWEINIFPEKYRTILMINPLFYIVNGYRDSFFNHIFFWHHPYLTIYYWGVTFFFILVGCIFYIKLKPHFADVM